MSCGMYVLWSDRSKWCGKGKSHYNVWKEDTLLERRAVRYNIKPEQMENVDPSKEGNVTI